jgi:hypothetical protein
MSRGRFLFLGVLVVIGLVGAIAWTKKSSSKSLEINTPALEEISIAPQSEPLSITPVSETQEEEIDRMDALFAVDSDSLPVVETVSYTSRVPWLKGRPAWIADYAAYYETSRHFIARSLNEEANYFAQKISPGDRFNVFRKDKQIEFHLLVDLNLCRLWLYCIDLGENQRFLLKTYRVGIGRPDSARASGYLTPRGKYLLGEKVAIYKPGTIGLFHNQKTEMIRVFGTRWMPFDKELDGCSEPAKGNGLHGLPWVQDAKTAAFTEDLTKLGKHESDGGICLAAKDIEEIFSIVLTKPTTVELVTDFHGAKLPGIEKVIP